MINNKIFLESLPKKNGKFERIDWNKSVGCKVKIIYSNKEYVVTIIEYLKNKRSIKLKIEDNIKIINTSSFLRMELGNITGKRNCEYIYKIGENIDNMEVLDTIRMKNGKSTCKGYKLKCLSDGYEWESTEYNILKGKRCPVCCNSPHVIIKGINDIATTHPYLVKYFVDIEDAYNNSYSSTKTVRMKCPNCKKNINKRIELLRYGYICPICNK